MILGLGLDLVEIDRMKESLERHGMAFAERILHPDEDAARAAAGIGEGLLRVAVGLENIEDIKADLARGLMA